MSEDAEPPQDTPGDPAQLQRTAEDLVTSLYDFNSRYFESHDVKEASLKAAHLQEKMHQALAELEQLQDRLPKALYLSLRGRALNVLPEHSPEAELCLSRAVKYDPQLIEAWIALGESYWKCGRVQQAHDCFTGSLSHRKTKEALRNLSIVQRQMGQAPEERLVCVRESVERAREAVSLDVQDGISWMILGNAYIALFFTAKQDAQLLTQTASAYAQAEKDPIAANNPDLHFNKATLHQYRSEYTSMLSSLALAAALDPAWPAPQEKLRETMQFLRSMNDLVVHKAKIKLKLITSLVSSLSAPAKYLGPLEGKKTLVNRVGLREGVNPDRVLLCAIATTVITKDRIPYGVVGVDGSGEGVGLMLFNLASSAQLSTGDILTVPDPILVKIIVEGEDGMEFWSVRVMDPSQLLLNGKTFPLAKLAPSEMSITAFN